MRNNALGMVVVIPGPAEMETLNLAFFYDLGTSLKPLVNMQASAQNRFEIVQAGWHVQPGIKILLDWPSELRVCRPQGQDLLDAIKKAQEWLFALKGEDWKKPNYDGDILFNAVINKAKSFEIVLREELTTLSVYHVTKKGIYQTSDLATQADRVFVFTVWDKLESPERQEVKDGGRCLAFDNSTACGFHMLRATEAVLYRYYLAVCKPKGKKKLEGWAAYISALYKLSQRPKLKPDTRDHVKKVLALLQQVKDQDRNAIMHPEEVLDADSAFNLFELTKSAIITMSEKLPLKVAKKDEQKATATSTA